MAANNTQNNSSAGGVRLGSVMDTYSTRTHVVKLGIQILEQLIELRNSGVKCAVFTPSDITVTPSGAFNLSGVSQRAPEKSDRLNHFIQLYTAPEAYDRVEGDGPSLFSLGTIMYKMLNGGLEPFRNDPGSESAEGAYKLRMSGIRISAPANADALLSAIILKACEYDANKRYQYAEDMLEELMLLADGNYQRKARVQPVTEAKEEEKEVRKTPSIVIGVGAAALVVVIAILIFNFRCNDIYISANRYMRDGKLVRAEEMFESISWYKDTALMLQKCDFYRADILLEEGKTDEAIEIYEELLKTNYPDAQTALNEALIVKAKELTDMGKSEEAMKILSSVAETDGGEANEIIDKNKREMAMSLYIDESYKEAIQIFTSLGDEEMVKECEYCIALDYKKNGDYAMAMAAFNALDDYNDSKKQFNTCEEWLISENKEQKIFKSFKNIEGRFEDEDGHYVEYSAKGDKIHSKYTLTFEEGEYFRLKDGIHYNSADSNSWEKQWIFQRVSDDELLVYDYIDAKVYTLKKK